MEGNSCWDSLKELRHNEPATWLTNILAKPPHILGELPLSIALSRFPPRVTILLNFSHIKLIFPIFGHISPLFLLYFTYIFFSYFPHIPSVFPPYFPHIPSIFSPYSSDISPVFLPYWSNFSPVLPLTMNFFHRFFTLLVILTAEQHVVCRTVAPRPPQWGREEQRNGEEKENVSKFQALWREEFLFLAWSFQGKGAVKSAASIFLSITGEPRSA